MSEMDPLYPAHGSSPRWEDSLTVPCGRCMGRARVADDWCRECAGRGFHINGKTPPAMLELMDGLSAAVAELSSLRVACHKAMLALTGIMPYLSRLPPESEQYVRKALKAIQSVAHG